MRAPGALPCSSTRCARRATGASATSPTCAIAGRAVGRARRRHRRRQSAACAVSCTTRRTPARTARRAGCFLNALYLDVEAIADFADCDAANALGRRRRSCGHGCSALRAAPSSSTTPASPQLKWPAARDSVRALPRATIIGHDSAARARISRLLRASAARRCAATRCSRRCRSTSAAPTPAVWGWPVWPEDYRDPDGARRAALRRSNTRERVEFYEYLQWQADAQLARGEAGARRAACGIGLYTRPRGVGRSRRRRRLGEPGRLRARRAASARRPTSSTSTGQNWGLPPPIPRALARAALRAVHRRRCAPNMRHAGALRIDHVMGCCACSGCRRARQCRAGRLRALSVRRPARHPRAREPSPPLPGDRRGSRHGARRVCASAWSQRRAVVPAADLRARRRAATSSRRGAYPARGAGGGQHARPADAAPGWWHGRDLERARAARPVSTRRAHRALRNRRALRERERLLDALQRERLLPPERRSAGAGACTDDARAGARDASLSGARAPRRSCWCSSRTLLQLRAGEPAGHHRRASELAPQAAVGRSSSGAPTRASAALARGAGARGAARATTRRAPQRRASRARPTACSCTATSRFAHATRAGALSRRARHQPRLLLAVTCARAPAACTATTSSTTTRSIRRSAARDDFDALRGRRCIAHGMGQMLRHRAEPHGRHGRRQRLVARRARERARRRRTPSTSTSTGSRSTRACAARCWCRCWATTTARARARRAAARFEAGAGASACAITSTAFRSIRASYPRI